MRQHHCSSGKRYLSSFDAQGSEQPCVDHRLTGGSAFTVPVYRTLCLHLQAEADLFDLLYEGLYFYDHGLFCHSRLRLCRLAGQAFASVYRPGRPWAILLVCIPASGRKQRQALAPHSGLRRLYHRSGMDRLLLCFAVFGVTDREFTNGKVSN